MCTRSARVVRNVFILVQMIRGCAWLRQAMLTVQSLLKTPREVERNSRCSNLAVSLDIPQIAGEGFSRGAEREEIM